MKKDIDKNKKQKKLKYGHVGRPTNEEVKEHKRLKNYKIIGIVFVLLLVIGGIFLYFNKDDLSLTAIMGNSVTDSTMKKVQNSSSYQRLTFNPDSYKSGYYYQTYADNGKTNFISYIFNKTGHSSSRYKWEKIQVFSDGKYITTFTTKSKSFKISEKYVGKNIALKIKVKSKSTNKNYTKYLRMFITSNLGGKNDCNLVINNTNSIASSFWWPIAPNNKKVPQTKRITQSFDNNHKGLDIAGSNATVIAAYDGVIQKVVIKGGVTNKPDRGTYVVIKHRYKNADYYTYYSHLKDTSVPSNIKKGAKVLAGTKLGVMGNTGYAFGVHLDFRLRKGGNTANHEVNPLSYISTSNPYPGGKWVCQ